MVFLYYYRNWEKVYVSMKNYKTKILSNKIVEFKNRFKEEVCKMKNYGNVIMKKPIESESYISDSNYVTQSIEFILEENKKQKNNRIIINTNLKRGLPLENINKLAGPMIEAWAYDVFSDLNEDPNNKYNLINVEAQERLSMTDIILQFKKDEEFITGSVDVKATSEDIKTSGKSPNITSFSRIRTAYVEDPDFMFIILSIKHKVYSKKNEDTLLFDGIMEITDFNAYDLKFISKEDISYNPALGTGQIQIKDIHYVTKEIRTTWEFCKLLDKKYLNSSRRTFKDWYREAVKWKWIKE